MREEPQAGEWWYVENYGRVHVVGRTEGGRVVVNTEDDSCDSFHPDISFDSWERLDGCTGWSWIRPDPALDCGKDYRLLTSDEIIQDGDEFLTYGGNWAKTGKSVGSQFQEGVAVIRRRVTPLPKRVPLRVWISKSGYMYTGEQKTSVDVEVFGCEINAEDLETLA